MQYGIIIYGIHWQYSTTITHGGCENIVLDNGINNAITAIENYNYSIISDRIRIKL